MDIEPTAYKDKKIHATNCPDSNPVIIFDLPSQAMHKNMSYDNKTHGNNSEQLKVR